MSGFMVGDIVGPHAADNFELAVEGSLHRGTKYRYNQIDEFPKTALSR